ncbi:MT-A70-domain-containing protein [Hyaloraphidium curvatum]|nr:MT-A70-domain-containing protein [Hyaloraphidium curvatum]
MSERRTRKRKRTEISSAHFVGYVLDEEPIDVIMKKFEELEKFEKELASSADGGAGAPGAAKPPALTDNQLEELFTRTSNFTVKSAVMGLHNSALDELDLLQMELGEWEGNQDHGWEDAAEEDDYMILDDNDWEAEVNGVSRKVRRSNVSDASERKSRSRAPDKDAIISRYKAFHAQAPTRVPAPLVLTRRPAGPPPDPSLPTYVRIPPCPVPRTWARHIQRLDECDGGDWCRYIEADVRKFDFRQLGTDFQCILLDPPLKAVSNSRSDGDSCISVEELGALDLSPLMRSGFIFIWVEKEMIPHVIRMAEKKWDCRYVENFAWVKKHLNNRIVTEESTYFRRSKLTCLIMRKAGEIEMRHQRSADCEFDFLKPRHARALTDEKPVFLYEVIETLLPQAIETAEPAHRRFRLLELWARPNARRHGWISVNHRPDAGAPIIAS